ncbi:MAG TPA: hypothetical protein VNV66_08280 [Pilimelia sp.]|nr:hypothetical protein [Pilimelia sp.]
MRQIIRRRTAASVAIAILLLMLVACDEKGQPLPVMREAEAVQMVRMHAERIAETARSTLNNWNVVSAPCEGRNGEVAEDGRWNLSGHAQIPVPESAQITTLQLIRERWQEQGYEITRFRSFGPEGRHGSLSAREPRNGVSITLSTTTPPQALAVTLLTPCYARAPGEDPANT